MSCGFQQTAFGHDVRLLCQSACVSLVYSKHLSILYGYIACLHATFNGAECMSGLCACWGFVIQEW